MRKLNYRKILMVGPQAAPGTYIGGIAVLSAQLLDCWDLPYDILTCNTNTVAREYGSVNRLNLTNVRRLFRNASDLATVVQREKPGIVHFHTSRHLALLKDLGLVSLLRALGCRVVGHVHHASYPTLFVGRAKWLRRMQIALLTARFDRLILMSQSIKRELSAQLGPATRRRFDAISSVLYNFTPLPELHPRRPSARPSLFFIGNVGQQKGIFDLLQALSGLLPVRQSRPIDTAGPAFELVLAGPFDSAAEGKRIRQAVRDAGLMQVVRLTGPVSGKAKEELFRASDVFVLPSHGEGVPLSMLEAMAYGLPVVATAVGGIPEILEDGKTGLLVPSRNPQALAVAIATLLRDSSMRERLGRLGRSRVEQRYSPPVFLRHLQTVYDGLVVGTAPIPASAPEKFESQEAARAS